MKNDVIYLVTGAAGFLGSNVCKQLLEAGKRVRALVLPNDKSVRFIPKEVEICLGDLCDARDLAAGSIATIEKGRIGESYILVIKFYLPLGIADKIAHAL